MAAETSLFSRYLSALKHTKHQQARPKGKYFYLQQQTSCIQEQNPGVEENIFFKWKY
jgi:hypothetical protein